MPTFIRLASVTLAADAASISVTGIPDTYRHLTGFYSLRSTLAATEDFVSIALNGDTTAANYDVQIQYGSGATPVSAEALLSRVHASMTGASSPANHFGMGRFVIPNYTAPNFKAMLSLGMSWRARSTGNTLIRNAVSDWASVAAVNAIAFTPFTGPNFLAGSRLTLYGIG